MIGLESILRCRLNNDRIVDIGTKRELNNDRIGVDIGTKRCRIK